MPSFDDLWAQGSEKKVVSALANSLVARATPGVLYGVSGWYAATATVYVCIFDASALPANNNPPATWPDHIIQVAGPGTFSLSAPPTGIRMSNGIVVAVSTTALPNFTVDTASKLHVSVMQSPIFGVS